MPLPTIEWSVQVQKQRMKKLTQRQMRITDSFLRRVLQDSHERRESYQVSAFHDKPYSYILTSRFTDLPNGIKAFFLQVLIAEDFELDRWVAGDKLFNHFMVGVGV